MAGRERLEAERRRERLLDAAHEAFVEVGYERASLDAIIAAAGGSRRTIYAEFGGKEGLLHAVIERIIADIASRAAEASAEVPADADPREWLVAVGLHFVGQMTRPDVIAVHRQLIALGGAGETTERLWAAGPDRFRATLERWLREQHEAGRLRVDDPAFVAATFPDLVRGSLQLELLAGRRREVSDEDIRRQVEGGIDLLMPALAPSRGDGPASRAARARTRRTK